MTAEIIDINERKEKYEHIQITINCMITFEDVVKKDSIHVHEEMDKQVSHMIKLMEDYMSGYKLSIERGNYSGKVIIK